MGPGEDFGPHPTATPPAPDENSAPSPDANKVIAKTKGPAPGKRDDVRRGTIFDRSPFEGDWIGSVRGDGQSKEIDIAFDERANLVVRAVRYNRRAAKDVAIVLANNGQSFEYNAKEGGVVTVELVNRQVKSPDHLAFGLRFLRRRDASARSAPEEIHYDLAVIAPGSIDAQVVLVNQPGQRPRVELHGRLTRKPPR